MKKVNESYDFDLILSKEVYDKQQKELRNKIIRNNKRNKRNEKIGKIFIFAIITLIILTLLYANKRMTNNYMNSCQENGYSYNYCLEHS